MAENPVRVSNATRERLRLAAAIMGKTQQEIVDEAVEEYVVRHPEEWAKGLQAARKALMDGTAAEYLVGDPYACPGGEDCIYAQSEGGK